MSKLEAECNFCRIITGKTPTDLFLASRWAYGFLAKEPTRLGHSIVLYPKAHVLNTPEVNTFNYLLFMYFDRLVQKALFELLCPNPYRVVELKSGFREAHLHRHHYPLTQTESWQNALDAFSNTNIPPYSSDERSELLLKLRHRFHYVPRKTG